MFWLSSMYSELSERHDTTLKNTTKVLVDAALSLFFDYGTNEIRFFPLLLESLKNIKKNLH